MISRAFHLKDSKLFTKKALLWGSQYENLSYLDSNGYRDNYGNLEVFIAVGAQDVFYPNPEEKEIFKNLQNFIDRYPQTWIPGFLGYDLKNELENLNSKNPNYSEFPPAHFFIPEFILLVGKFNLEIYGENEEIIERIFQEIKNIQLPDLPKEFKGNIEFRMSKDQYRQAFQKMMEHILKGDIYEANLCQEFYIQNAEIDPVPLFLRLNEISQTPFACFYKFGDHFILSASPERFLSKNKNILISQPIKGTAKRGSTEEEDAQIKINLSQNPKEISENVMIVDLVRNDLTKSAKEGSVKVMELTKVYSFKQVHQLISTISCEMSEGLSPVKVIENTFPPGSMTGAPKIRAMEIIDEIETSSRGVYSGAIGYFSPQGNFDFSVVIRTLLFNREKKYLSFHTGGAITAGSKMEDEYAETLLKGKAIFELLKS